MNIDSGNPLFDAIVKGITLPAVIVTRLLEVAIPAEHKAMPVDEGPDKWPVNNNSQSSDKGKKLVEQYKISIQIITGVAGVATLVFVVDNILRREKKKKKK